MASFNIPAQEASKGVVEFSRASGLQLLISSRHAKGRVTNAVMGQLSAEQGLARLLDGTGLEARRTAPNTWTVLPSANPAVHTGQTGTSDDVPPVTDIPEILVRGIRYWSLNSGIPRTESDTQPYIVFEREQLARSGAHTLEDFFRSYLGPNTAVGTSEVISMQSGLGRLNLRGFGPTETLILIDGRRLPPANDGSGFIGQPNVAWIPLDSIERIEVLASSASSIYGANASGGVINIVRKRDYDGIGLALKYGDVIEGSARENAVELTGGRTFNEEATRASFSAAAARSEPLLNKYRRYSQRLYQRSLQVDPNYFRDNSVLPMGTTPNIRSADGRELIFDDGTPLGSNYTHVPDGYRGFAIDGAAGLLANAGSFNLQSANTLTMGDLTPLFSERSGASATMAVRHKWDRYDAYAELSASKDTWREVRDRSPWGVTIQGNAPNNPFRQSIRVSVPNIGDPATNETIYRTWRAIAGVVAELPSDWQAFLDLTWSKSTYSKTQLGPPVDANTFASISNGTQDVIRDIRMFPVSYNYASTVENSAYNGPADAYGRTAALRLAGPLPVNFGAGPVVTTLLFEVNKDSLGHFQRSLSGSTVTQVWFTPSRSLLTRSAYVEIKAPLFSEANALPLLEELDLQIALRRDKYSGDGADAEIPCRVIRLPGSHEEEIHRRCPNEGVAISRAIVDASTTNPTYSLRWMPLNGATVRASYATGFLPVNLHEVIKPPLTQLQVEITDPLRGGEPIGDPISPGSSTLVVTGYGDFSGGNPDLEPERSKSLSAGLILEPSALAGFRISADWTRIDKRGKFYNPFLLLVGDARGLRPGGQATFEAVFITLHPERVTRAAPSDGYTVGRITSIDASILNLLGARSESWDYAIDYQKDFAKGRLDLSMRGTYLKDLSVQYAPGSPSQSLAGVIDYRFALGIDPSGGVRKKGALSASWTTPSWQFGWSTRYIDGYYLHVDRIPGPGLGSNRVRSQTYHDLFWRQQIGEKTSILFSLNNVFDKKPPVDLLGSYSGFADPRQAHYSLRVSHDF